MTNGFHIHRADVIGISTLLGAYTLQDVATIASIFAFLATGIYYSVQAYLAWKRKGH
jgi:hypothetical protein